jgi:hypothetical protein
MKTYKRNPNFLNIRIDGINEDKVKFSQYLIQQCAMNVYGEVVMYLLALLAMALFVGELITTHLQIFF